MNKKIHNRVNTKNNTLKVILITLFCISTVSYIIYYLTDNQNNDAKIELTKNNILNENTITAEKNIVYLFYSPSCGYCHRAMSYIETNLKNKYQNIEFKYINVSLKEGRTLYFKFKESLNILSNGVPVMVIGKKHIVGFGENTGDEYIRTINEEVINKQKK